MKTIKIKHLHWTELYFIIIYYYYYYYYWL